ncbi:MAG: 30S ribosomal protein S1 [Acidobacteria bacterium]|nr:30S ribosomal protein S1 [Acidobacteriota bacterium]
MTGFPEELRASAREDESNAGGPGSIGETAEAREESATPASAEAPDSSVSEPPESDPTVEAEPETPADAPASAAPAPEPPPAPVAKQPPPALPSRPLSDWQDAPEAAASQKPTAASPAPAPEAKAPAAPSAPPPLNPPSAPSAAPAAAPSAASAPAPAVQPQSAPPPPLAQRPAAPAAPAFPALPAVGFVPGLPSEPGADEGDDEMEALEQEQFEAALLDYVPEVVELRPGDRRSGTVVSVGEDAVVVDIGSKTEGVLSLRNAPRPEDLQKLQPGQEIEVQVARLGEPGEYVHLSLIREENNEEWEALEEAFRERRPIVGKVLERVKGGLTVDVGLPAFLPGSQASVRPQHDLDALVGEEFEVLVVKLSRRRSNIVVSRRELLEQEINSIKQETLSQLSLGAVVTGRIKNVTSYGAFVDLGGIDGLIHVTDISHGRVKDPSQALQPGEEVTAKVIKFDPDKERVSLSLKEMQSDPWEDVSERYHEGDRVSGKVASVTDYGAFVELEPGVEGLIHITEMSWSKRLKHPSKVVHEGEDVDSVVLKVQPEQRRISLSLKQVAADPWARVDGKYQVGSVVEGRVRNVTTYGVFVEVEEGVDGLIHVSDLSWDSRVRNPKDFVKKGQQLRTVVLNVDPDNRRMSLGVKQLEPDIWETFFTSHVIGDVVPGRLSRMVKFGAFVELAPGVEGLCHNSEMPARRGRKGGLQPGLVYEFEILKMDEFEKRIGLRCLSYEPLAQEPAAAPPPPEFQSQPELSPKSEPEEPAAAEPEAQAGESIEAEPVAEVEAEPVAGSTAEEPVEEAPAEQAQSEEQRTEP